MDFDPKNHTRRRQYAHEEDDEPRGQGVQCQSH